MNNEYMDNNGNEEEEKRGKKKAILIIIALLLIVLGAASFGYYLFTQYDAKQNQKEISAIVSQTEVSNEKKVENPIDFKSLQKKNSDIYAWIKVPGTKVDYPVVQSSTDDEFYLKHSALDKSWIASGAVYSEMGNTKTFSDRVTVLYGHNGYSDTMFTTLHKFEKKDFFDEHEFFYIYTPDSKRTYRIISAFKYDDRHILNSFDFQDNDVFEEFMDMIQSPQSNNKNVRKELDKELTKNDNIIVLSTCITNQRSNRYLVCGVLIKNEKTD